jgi:serine/threonine-protein kinase
MNGVGGMSEETPGDNAPASENEPADQKPARTPRKPAGSRSQSTGKPARKPAPPRKKPAAPVPAAPAPAAGAGSAQAIAGYLLEEQIGEGGMAVVYRARDERLDRHVALKLLAPALTADPGFRQRFIRESRSAAAVDHPNIIPIYEAGDVGGSLFIAMRYVHGGDVRKLLQQGGPLPPARAWSIISQVASALDAAHAHGLIHRDVKPANMLLDRRPGSTGPGGSGPAGDEAQHVYLSDFGISKQSLAASSLTMTGQFVGTLDYIAPEQIDGSDVDGRTDLYSLGCAAYELLSGVPPFSKSQGLALVRAHITEPPPAVTAHRRELPPAANGVLAAAMAKQPSERYGSCAQFAINLGRALGLVPGAPELPRNLAGGPGLGGPAPAVPVHPSTELAAAVPAPGPAPGPAASFVPYNAQQATMAPAGPVPMGPPGQRPGGPGGPGGTGWTPQAPRPPRSRGVIVGVIGAVAAVAAAAVVAVVLVGHGNHAGQANEVGRRTSGSTATAPRSSAATSPAPSASSTAALPTATPTVSPATAAPDPAASAQASTVSSLLSSGSGSAAGLNNAVNDVANCGDIASDISEIQSVESQRQNEYDQAQSTQMNDLPSGAQVKADLLQALHYSLVADQDYLNYANQMESSSCQSGSQAAAIAADGQAVTYKDDFLSLWNPIASTYSLPQLTVSSI